MTQIPVGDDMLWWNPAPRNRRDVPATQFIAGEPLTATAENCSRGDYRTIPTVHLYPTTSKKLYRGMCPWCRTTHSILRHHEVEDWTYFTIWGAHDWRYPDSWCPEYPERMVNVYAWGTAATVRLAA